MERVNFWLCNSCCLRNGRSIICLIWALGFQAEIVGIISSGLPLIMHTGLGLYRVEAAHHVMSRSRVHFALLCLLSQTVRTGFAAQRSGASIKYVDSLGCWEKQATDVLEKIVTNSIIKDWMVQKSKDDIDKGFYRYQKSYGCPHI